MNLSSLSADLLKQLESWEQVIEKTRSYAAEQVDGYLKPARAYNYRYLAHRAVMMRANSMAVKFINQALITDWSIVYEEPKRTIRTLVAAYCLWLLPRPLYYQIEALAIKARAVSQQRQIAEEKLRQST